MVSGISILEDRDKLYPQFKDIILSLPSIFLKKLFSILDKLHLRVNESASLIEAYTYETNSRFLWKTKKNYILNSSNLTGIQGTSSLGLNSLQNYWVALNAKEDSKELFDEQYSLIKFLASFTDPKSIRKINTQDKAKEEEEEKRRANIKENKENNEYDIYDPTSTKEGIVAELEKQMSGVKDEHDLAVEAYEKKLRVSMLKQMNDLKKMQESRKDSDVYEEARPISKEEMMERIERSRNKPKITFQALDE